jgi:hypothetical protein
VGDDQADLVIGKARLLQSLDGTGSLVTVVEDPNGGRVCEGGHIDNHSGILRADVCDTGSRRY